MVATATVEPNFTAAESAPATARCLLLCVTEKVVVALTNAGLTAPLLMESPRSRSATARSGNVNQLPKSGSVLPIRYAMAGPGNYSADAAIAGAVAATRSMPANCYIRQFLWRAV